MGILHGRNTQEFFQAQRVNEDPAYFAESATWRLWYEFVHILFEREKAKASTI
jgi:hypothetical protein